LQRTGATPGSMRQTFSSTMTPVYSCPIHGLAKSSNIVRRYDATPSCSLYATPPYHGPCRAGVARRHAGCDRCRARPAAPSSPFTGSSGCLAGAGRRQTDSADSVLLPALDVVAGQDLSATNHALRPPSGHSDLSAAEKSDTEGVFYTANSQHPEPCGHVSDLLLSTSWAREHDVSNSAYDLQTNEPKQSESRADDCRGQQSTLSDANSAGNDRTQPMLLVDFHC